MIDFHSHILPCMDDGSTSVEMSLSMLEMSAGQGVTQMVATPHFYGNRETPSAFLERRSKTFKLLQERCKAPALPKIYLGAEVAYYSGLSSSDFLDDLCIENTNLLLIELPFAPCSDHCYREIASLRHQGYQPMIAHVERYLGLQPQKPFLQRLRNSGALIQCNGDFFLQGWRSRKAFSMTKKGYVDILGSDCHNLTARAPNLGLAMERLQAKLGAEWMDSFLRYEDHLLEKAFLSNMEKQGAIKF